MIFAHTREPAKERIQFSRLAPTRKVPGILDDARQGLLETPRALPPRYFFDARGIRLLAELRQAPEFYLGRSEASLLSRHAGEILRAVRPSQIVEFAAGLAGSSRILLEASRGQPGRMTYWPLYHNREALQIVVQGLAETLPDLSIHAIEGDCLGGLRHLPASNGSRLYLLLGSAIGHFTPSQTQRFLIDVRNRMSAGDVLLLGIDRVMDAEVLNAAYNDAGGYVAAFNRHLLQVLNRELSADFDPQGYDHYACYNAALQQMELYLTARSEQNVQINGLQRMITVAAGESIRTGVCRKFTLKGMQAMLTTAGFALEQHYQNEQADYSLLLAVPRHARLTLT